MPDQNPGSLLQRLIRKNRSTRLVRYFRDVAAASLAASMISVGAAGCDNGAWPENTDGFDALSCGGAGWTAAQGLTPERSFTYIGVYQSYSDFFEGPEPTEATLIHGIGTICGEATDVTACEANATDPGTASGRFVVLTEGDEVRQYRGHDQLMELLGTIDTPQEALLLAWMDGMEITCDELSRTAVREMADGYEVVVTDTEGDCGSIRILRRFKLHIASTGETTQLDVEELEREDLTNCAIGRRPEGLLPREQGDIANPAGDYFARIAYLEASAVSAFEILERELRAHGAPDEILAEVRRAAEDEVRHAEVMGAIAERLGGTPEEAHLETRDNRSLYEIALDNATEGCIRETYGALLGTYQSMATPDPQVRQAMSTVAEDETFHAELSWKIHDWILPQLSEGQRTAIAAAQRQAVAKLRDDVIRVPEPAIARFAGLPAPEQAVALVDHLAQDLWN